MGLAPFILPTGPGGTPLTTLGGFLGHWADVQPDKTL